MNIKTITKLASAVAIIAFMASAQAISITPSSSPQITGPETSQSEINDAVAAATGNAALLYKQDAGAGSDEGTLRVATRRLLQAVSTVGQSLTTELRIQRSQAIQYICW